MNEELQKALLAILNKTVSAADAGVSFLQQELPEVIKQLLMWKAVESVILFIAMLAVTIIITILIVKLANGLRSFKPKNAYDSDMNYCIALFFLSIVDIFCFVAVLNSLTWLKILLAPKLYLVEFAASLVK